jgi:hypothetical protein
MIAFMPNICVLPITYASERLVAGDFNHDGLIRESFLIKNIFLNSKNPQLEADVFVDCQIDDVIIDPFL